MSEMVYIFAILIATCLVIGQSSWGGAVKTIAPVGSDITSVQLLLRMIMSYRFWIGASFYALGTVLYLLLLSKARFFSVQITMTGVALILSTGVSYFVFHETIHLYNLVGLALVLAGITLVTLK